MPAYATAADLELALAGTELTAPAGAELDALLERASRDVDAALGPANVITTGAYAGFKVDPTALAEPYRAGLARGTAAQARHRLELAAAAAAGPGVKRVKGPDFEREYDLTTAPAPSGRFAVELADELAVLGLPRRTARAR